MENPKIYVACLDSFKICRIYGVWIDAYQDINDIQDQINDMLARSPVSNAETWTILYYKGFGEITLYNYYDDLETIINFAKFIIKHGELGQTLIAYYGIDEALTMMENHYHGYYDSRVDFARYVLEEYYSNPIPNNWLGYFDYEAYARDLFIDDFCSVEVGGYVHVFGSTPIKGAL